MNQAALYGFCLALGYFFYRLLHLPEWLNGLFSGEGSYGFFIRMPAAPLLLALLPFQFMVAKKCLTRGMHGFAVFRETGKTALMTALFSALAVWLYYGFIDPNYLPGLLDAVEADLPSTLSADDRSKYMDNLKTLNSINLRVVFTLSGLTAYGLISGLAMVSLARSLRR